jgi:hypothetical protein
MKTRRDFIKTLFVVPAAATTPVNTGTISKEQFEEVMIYLFNSRIEAYIRAGNRWGKSLLTSYDDYNLL